MWWAARSRQKNLDIVRASFSLISTRQRGSSSCIYRCYGLIIDCFRIWTCSCFLLMMCFVFRIIVFAHDSLGWCVHSRHTWHVPEVDVATHAVALALRHSVAPCLGPAPIRSVYRGQRSYIASSRIAHVVRYSLLAHVAVYLSMHLHVSSRRIYRPCQNAVSSVYPWDTCNLCLCPFLDQAWR